MILVTGAPGNAGGGVVRSLLGEAAGPLDILVANAGGSLTPPAPLEEIPEDPGMKQRGRGVIITMASSAGRKADARAPIPYGAAKAAIVLLTQDAAAQAGPSGVRVNCIAPETILTERNRQLIPAAQQAAWAGQARAEPTRLSSSPPARKKGLP
jgi:3-oxoacyl-[acyl-carrier protein] reductase